MDTGMIFPLVAALLVCGAVLVIGIIVVRHNQKARMRRSLALVLHIGSIKPDDEGLATIDQLSSLRAAIRWTSDRMVGEKARIKMRQRLSWAGRPTNEALTAAVDQKVIYLVAGFVLGLLLGLLLGGLWWLAWPICTVLGFFVPNILIYNEGLTRTNQILLDLPDALDMLNLCVESGLSMQAALTRVADAQEGPVAAEFGRVLQEMQLGVSRSAAFEAMGERTNQEDLQRFVTAMLQVDQLGIPVANVLHEQAADMRAKRFARAREQAQKVPIKILMPLLLCFMPALFIMVLGPAILQAMHQMK